MQLLGMSLEPWLVLGLLAFGVAVTVVTNWLAAKFRQPVLPRGRGLTLAAVVAVIAHLIWIALIWAAGVIAVRYIERISNALVGYLVFGFVAFLLSLVRALLYRRVQEQQRPKSGPDWENLLRTLLHNLTYLLFAIVLYLVLCWLLRRPAEPLLFVPLCIGALLPDLDSQGSFLGRLLPFISQRLEACLGHGQEWHTLAAAALVALITAPLILLVGLEPWYLVPLGFFSHLLLDALNSEGVMLFWPVNRTRYFILGFIESPGDAGERWVAVVLALIAVPLLFVVDLGAPPPPPVAVPSYEQSLERYHGLRGRNLVFADVEGAWQATGRRVSGRFEILNAVGQSYIMLDRYTGRVFTAGRTATDNLYLNAISVLAGSTASVRAVEVHLRDQRLVEALPLVYQMQREPGLQHIFISGDVLVLAASDAISPTLQVDYAQTRLRKIQANEAGHYTFHYLTASELIELADLGVEVADLVIVATYIRPASGPTATPLPSPPPKARETP